MFDLFGDRDTREMAETHVLTDENGLFDEPRLLQHVATVVAAHSVRGLVYGGGLECLPELLERLARVVPLCGNPPEVVRACKTPERFFSCLARLGIPFPETRFFPPPADPRWLVKPRCGTGGKRVGFHAAREGAGAAVYFQRHVSGVALSALFLADGRTARVVGFNTLWSENRGGETPFLFAGTLNRTPLGDAHRAEVQGWVESLSGALGLTGLNGLDFMFDGQRCHVLEVNPRPSATLTLYDADYPQGILAAHLDACAGRLPAGDLPASPPRAWRVVYAPRDGQIPPVLEWPAWSADRPPPGARFRAGEPLCTVCAEGATGEDAAALSTARCDAVLALCGAQ
ncbi:MAG TPA: ATP-grasp domain-containing protein [Methylococcaceae bacterium]|nr:ATP-grasp domain-containing protein [Methylococcaceae bacterium]